MKGKDELEHSIWENKARIPNGQRNSIPYKHIPGKQEGGSSLMNLGTVDISQTGSDLASLLWLETGPFLFRSSPSQSKHHQEQERQREGPNEGEPAAEAEAAREHYLPLRYVPVELGGSIMPLSLRLEKSMAGALPFLPTQP
jgi:hypothetical protein